MPLPLIPFFARLAFMIIAAGSVSILLHKLRNDDPDDPDPPGSPVEKATPREEGGPIPAVGK